MSAAAAARGAFAALVVYAVVVIVALLPARAFEVGSSGQYAAIAIGSFIATAAGAAAGAWQARAGGARVPWLGLLVGALAAILAGFWLTAQGGADDAGLIYLGHALGGLTGAILYGRRWLAGVR